MPVDYWEWITKGATVVFATLFIKSALKAKEYNEQEKELHSADIYDFRKSDKMKAGESIFIKAKLKDTMENKIKTKKRFTKKLCYNELYLEEPSDYRIISEIQKENKNNPFNQDNILIFVDWRGKEKNFHGIDKVIGDVYEIKCTYQINMSAFNKFIGFIGYCLEFFIDKVRKSRFHDQTFSEIRKDRAPFIKGPAIGTLKSSVELVSDQNFLIKVILQNGLHKISILSESKGCLSDFYTSLSIQYQAKAIVCLFLTIATGYYAFRNSFKSIRKRVNLLASRGMEGFKEKVLELQNVEESQTCTICYVNCRNVILFNCKHLALCWECFKDFKSEKCCHCKGHIEGVQIVYADRKENMRRDHDEEWKEEIENE